LKQNTAPNKTKTRQTYAK